MEHQRSVCDQVPQSDIFIAIFMPRRTILFFFFSRIIDNMVIKSCSSLRHCYVGRKCFSPFADMNTWKLNPSNDRPRGCCTGHQHLETRFIREAVSKAAAQNILFHFMRSDLRSVLCVCSYERYGLGKCESKIGVQEKLNGLFCM